MRAKYKKYRLRLLTKESLQFTNKWNENRNMHEDFRNAWFSFLSFSVPGIVEKRLKDFDEI